jgi:outer membrane protein assembly factor BamA
MIKLIFCLAILLTPGVVLAKVTVAEVNRSLDLINEQSLAARVGEGKGRVLIRQIIIDGFLLKENQKLAPMIKRYRNKKLTPDEVKEIVAAVKKLYVEAGYEKLVDLSYKIDKKGRMTIRAALRE